MRKLQAVLSSLAVGLFLCLGLALAPRADAAASPPVPDLAWSPCDSGFECATAEVPRDYARPHGPKIELALISKPASDRENRIGSLFLNPGGPGGSGVDFVKFAPPPALARLAERYDVVGFDPRGAGASSPAISDCGYRYESDHFFRPETLDRGALLGRATDQIRRCVGANGSLLPHLHTANAARDLDLLRAGVGDEKLNYLGFSYGGMIGETYTTLFPGRTGALVIDAPIDGDVWLNEPFEAIREQLASFEGSLDRFFNWCTRREGLCSLDPEDPEDDFDTLLARLDAHPVPVGGDPAGSQVNGDEVLETALGVLYSKFSWAPFAAALAQVEAGEGTLMHELAGSAGPEATGAFFAYLATEVRYPHRVRPFLRSAEHNYGLFDHFWWVRGYEWVGAGLYPVEPRGAYRGPFRHAAGARTALVIGGTHDPATPYKWARRYVADLGNARLLTYRGDGHGAITDLNPCVLGTVLAYLEENVLPPEGASCKQQIPVAASAARAATSAERRDAWKRMVR